MNTLKVRILCKVRIVRITMSVQVMSPVFTFKEFWFLLHVNSTWGVCESGVSIWSQQNMQFVRDSSILVCEKNLRFIIIHVTFMPKKKFKNCSGYRPSGRKGLGSLCQVDVQRFSSIRFKSQWKCKEIKSTSTVQQNHWGTITIKNMRLTSSV